MLLVYICLFVVNADKDGSFGYDEVNVVLFKVLGVSESIVVVIDVVDAANDVDDNDDNCVDYYILLMS